MKVITIIGARPQFIKAGTISREIAKRSNFREIIVHTGQHYDSNMSDVFFDEMKIPKPDYHLGIGGNSHGAMTGQMIEKIEEIILKENPDWVLVYGDTNSTLAGAIAASKLHVKIAHVEAGLRSFNTKMPEEINRILTDRVSSILFCPTSIAAQNLEREGIQSWKNDAKLVLSGDVMQDGAIFYKKLAEAPSNIKLNKSYILCTVHRAENTDSIDKLESIFSAISTIAENTQVIIPLHPRTKGKIDKLDIDISKITFIEPVGYLNMVWLIMNSDLVITDSGGLQKEAYFFEKCCITLREETEWMELVDIGANILVGTDAKKILASYGVVKNTQFDFPSSLYGNGQASELIIDEMLSYN